MLPVCDIPPESERALLQAFSKGSLFHFFDFRIQAQGLWRSGHQGENDVNMILHEKCRCQAWSPYTHWFLRIPLVTGTKENSVVAERDVAFQSPYLCSIRYIVLWISSFPQTLKWAYPAHGVRIQSWVTKKNTKMIMLRHLSPANLGSVPNMATYCWPWTSYTSSLSLWFPYLSIRIT